MSIIIGDVPYFNSLCSDWQVYTERLEQFFEVNDFAPEKRKALLITSLDDETYKTLRDVCHPTLPKDKTYDELIELLSKQYIVRTSIFRERVKFYQAKQFGNESVASWYARIKRLSLDCKFGDRFDSVLLDRFISGLRSSVILDRLCEEGEDLSLQKAVEIASNKESSSKGNTVGGGAADDNDDDGNNENNQHPSGGGGGGGQRRQNKYRNNKKRN